MNELVAIIVLCKSTVYLKGAVVRRKQFCGFTIDDLYRRIAWHFGPRRMQEFVRLFRPNRQTTVLDVGGTSLRWQMAKVQCRVVMCNIDQQVKVSLADVETFVMADGCALPFSDQSFDIVFSNSVIEHVGDWERQKQFATETRRVGKRYYVQTPDRNFPIETHYVAPLMQFLPLGIRWRASRFCTPWGLLTKPRPNKEQARAFADEIRLLNAREMQALFPDAQLLRERLLGFPKSLIAIKL